MPCKKFQGQIQVYRLVSKKTFHAEVYCGTTVQTQRTSGCVWLYCYYNCKYVEKGNKILGALCVPSVFQYGSHFHILGSSVRQNYFRVGMRSTAKLTLSSKTQLLADLNFYPSTRNLAFIILFLTCLSF